MITLSFIPFMFFLIKLLILFILFDFLKFVFTLINLTIICIWQLFVKSLLILLLFILINLILIISFGSLLYQGCKIKIDVIKLANMIKIIQMSKQTNWYKAIQLIKYQLSILFIFDYSDENEHFEFVDNWFGLLKARTNDVWKWVLLICCNFTTFPSRICGNLYGGSGATYLVDLHPLIWRIVKIRITQFSFNWNWKFELSLAN